MSRIISTEEVKLHNSFNDCWISYRSNVYDITKFVEHHPGGLQILENHLGSDITHVLESPHIHKHSVNAIKLLESYKIGKLEEINSPNEQETYEDEDMDGKIDWNRGILSQLEKLGNRYEEWTYVPTCHRIILFDSYLLEILSVSHWTIVPIVWIPIMVAFLRLSHNTIKMSLNQTDESIIYFIMALFFMYGIILWTLMEYSLHRFLFHFNTTNRHKYTIIIHFCIHGLHHKSPFDNLRLVFPPVPAIMIASILFLIHKVIFGYFITVCTFGGVIFGYILYDMIHYAMHHSEPIDPYLQKMKRIHNAHHYTDHDKGFGVSSDLWDHIFDTRVKLRY